MKKPDAGKCTDCSYGPPDWQYKCLDCGKIFAMPAPKGPADERNRRCLGCNSHNIEHRDMVKSEACPPGG